METQPKGPIELDAQSPEPGYVQLARILAYQIASHQWEPGSRLPQERDLASRYKVSRFMVRNALDILAAQGCIRRVHGRGTFVASADRSKRWFSTAPTIQFVCVGATPASPLPLSGYYGKIMQGVCETAGKLHLDVQAQGHHSYVRVPLEEYKPPRPSEVGGVVLCGTFDEQYLSMFTSEGVPTVTVDFWSHSPNIDSVVVDVESDAYAALDHLMEKGHTRVGFLALGRKERGDTTGVFEYDPDIWRLLDSLRRSAQRRRVQMRDDWIRLTLLSKTQSNQVVRDILNLRDRPTALICFNETAMTLALRTIEDTGLRCPEDISVITRGCEPVEGPPVTMLMGDPKAMGQTAVELLVGRMQGKRQHAVRTALVSRLVLGDTTGPAPR